MSNISIKYMFKKYNIQLQLLSLLFICVVIYQNVIHYDFVSYDDVLYLNALQKNVDGIWGTFQWAFGSIVNFNWSPLTLLSLSLDYKMYGLNAGGYHFSNVILHYFNSIILLLIIKSLFKNNKLAYLISLIFLIHPINVEAVSWVSERKGVLSAFFTLTSIYFYLKFSLYNTRNIFYGLSLMFFCFGLLSKAVFVGVPLFFMVIDWFIFKERYRKQNLFESFSRLIPFFICSLIIGVVTLLVHSQSGAIVADELNPVYNRLGNAVNSYTVYLKQFFYPFGLSFLYRYRPINDIIVFINVIILLSIFYLAYININSRRYVMFGVAWYTLFLLPVIGIVQSGFHAHADRYAYIPLIGLYIIVVSLLLEMVNKLKLNSLLLKVAGGMFFLIIMFISFTQVSSWKNNKYLSENALLVDTNNYAANTTLAITYILERNLPKAMFHYDKAKKSDPHFLKMYYLVSDNLYQIGKKQLAVDVLFDLLENNNNNLLAYIKISKIKISQKEYIQAKDILYQANEISESNTEINYLLAVCYYNLNQPKLAKKMLGNILTVGSYSEKIMRLLDDIEK